MNYAWKLLKGVLSGFDDLQVRVGDEWEYIPHEISRRRDVNGEWHHSFKYLKFPDHAYYVCVAWRNGSHTPLPIVLGDFEDEGEKAQEFLVKFLNKGMGFLEYFKNADWAGPLSQWRTAFVSCAYYEHQASSSVDGIEEKGD